MPASDEFKKALRSGDLPEAFVMAMGKATELNITTKIVKADGSIAEDYNPAQCLETRLDLLSGTIENRIGEEFVGTSKYRELQQFHQQQVALGNRKIQENFQSLQQLFRLLVTLQQYNRISNAEEPLDLTFLEMPTPVLPAERVITHLREQEEILAEKLIEMEAATTDTFAERTDEEKSPPTKTKVEPEPPEPTQEQPPHVDLIAPPPPKPHRKHPPHKPAAKQPHPPATSQGKPAPPPEAEQELHPQPAAEQPKAQPAPPKVDPIIAAGVAGVAAATVAAIADQTEKKHTPQADDEDNLNFLDSFAALDLDEAPEPEMPVSDVEMDDWETTTPSSPAERISQNEVETYVPSLADFDRDPMGTDTVDAFDDFSEDDDLSNLLETDSPEINNDLGDLLLEDETPDFFEQETADVAPQPTDINPTPAPSGTDDFDLDALMDENEAFITAETTENGEGDWHLDELLEEDTTLDETPVLEDREENFAEDERPDFSEDEGDFLTAEMSEMSGEEATDDVIDFDSEEFAPALADFSNFNDLLDASTPDPFEEIDEDTEEAMDDLLGFEPDNIQLETSDPAIADLESTDTDLENTAQEEEPEVGDLLAAAEAVSPAVTSQFLEENLADEEAVTAPEPAQEETDILDNELLDFLDQDWQSHPEVMEITSLDEEGTEAVLQPLTEEELATLENVDDIDWLSSTLDDDWEPLNSGESSGEFSGGELDSLSLDLDEDDIPETFGDLNSPAPLPLVDGDLDEDGLELAEDWAPLGGGGAIAEELEPNATDLGEETFTALDLDLETEDIFAADEGEDLGQLNDVNLGELSEGMDPDVGESDLDLDMELEDSSMSSLDLDMEEDDPDLAMELEGTSMSAMAAMEDGEDFGTLNSVDALPEDFSDGDMDLDDLGMGDLDLGGETFDENLDLDSVDNPFTDDLGTENFEPGAEDDGLEDFSLELEDMGELGDFAEEGNLDGEEEEDFDISMEEVTDLDGMDEESGVLDLNSDELDLLDGDGTSVVTLDREGDDPDFAEDLDLGTEDFADPFGEASEPWGSEDPTVAEDSMADLQGEMDAFGEEFDPLADLGTDDLIIPDDGSDFSLDDLDTGLDPLVDLGGEDLNLDDLGEGAFDLDNLGEFSAEEQETELMVADLEMPMAEPVALEDDFFSQEVLSSIQELDQSTANLTEPEFDLDAEMDELLHDQQATAESFALDLGLDSPATNPQDFDLDSLALESDLELQDFELRDDLDLDEAIANAEGESTDGGDWSDFELDLGDDSLMMPDDFDIEAPIDLGLEPDSESDLFGESETQGDAQDQDWQELAADPAPQDDSDWDALENMSSPADSAAGNLDQGTEDWAIADLGEIGDISDDDLAGLGDFDLDALESDDNDDFDLFGKESDEALNPFLDPKN